MTIVQINPFRIVKKIDYRECDIYSANVHIKAPYVRFILSIHTLNVAKASNASVTLACKTDYYTRLGFFPKIIEIEYVIAISEFSMTIYIRISQTRP